MLSYKTKNKIKENNQDFFNFVDDGGSYCLKHYCFQWDTVNRHMQMGCRRVFLRHFPVLEYKVIIPLLRSHQLDRLHRITPRTIYVGSTKESGWKFKKCPKGYFLYKTFTAREGITCLQFYPKYWQAIHQEMKQGTGYCLEMGPKALA